MQAAAARRIRVGYFMTVTYTYHHMGIPTDEVCPGERYSSTFKMYTAGGEEGPFHVQRHRFEPGCPLHPLLQTRPHVAFKVESIDEAIRGKRVILEPYYPFRVFAWRRSRRMVHRSS